MKGPEDDWREGPPMTGPVRHREEVPFEEPPPENDPPEFAAIRRIELLGRLHHMAFRALLQNDGLPPAQAGALRTVIRYPGLSQRELAGPAAYSAGHRHGDAAKNGAIRLHRPPARSGGPADLPHLPHGGRQGQDAESKKAVDAYFARCFAGVSEKEFSAMEAALCKLGENLREILSENPDPMDKE